MKPLRKDLYIGIAEVRCPVSDITGTKRSCDVLGKRDLMFLIESYHISDDKSIIIKSK